MLVFLVTILFNNSPIKNEVINILGFESTWINLQVSNNFPNIAELHYVIPGVTNTNKARLYQKLDSS